MSQGKQNKFLTIYFSALGVGALGLGYLAWSASSGQDEAEKKFKLADADLKRLQSAPLSRTKENADKKKALVAEYVGKVTALNETLRKYQAPLNATESGESFQKKLGEAAKTVIENAKAKQVRIDPKFDLGMGNYLTAGEFPQPGTAPQLAAQLDGIIYLVDTAMAAGVNSIDSLTRAQLEIEKDKVEAPAPKAGAKPPAKPTATAKKEKVPAGPLLDEAKVLERQAVTLTVTGKNPAIMSFLEKLANSSPETMEPHFFVIRTLRIENEQKDGPLKTQTVQQTETPDPIEKDKVIVKDAMFLIGKENVRMQLDLDLIRFTPEPPSTEKSKPADKPKSASSTPAPTGK